MVYRGAQAENGKWFIKRRFIGNSFEVLDGIYYDTREECVEALKNHLNEKNIRNKRNRLHGKSKPPNKYNMDEFLSAYFED